MVLAMLAGAVAPGRGAAPQDAYCAFEVTVRSLDGAAVRGVTVSEEAQDGGKIVSAVTDARGGARLCDAPAGLVSIRVGGRLCGAASVGYLMPRWLQTRRVYLTYEGCSGEEWAVPGGCGFMRVRDARERPVREDLPVRSLRGRDERTRRERGLFQPGYQPGCRSGGPSRAEVAVVMPAAR